MSNIKIISEHNSLEAAIDAAGGCNRDYNPATFDRRVAEIKKSASRDVFYVLEHYGRPQVAYHYSCDIELVNGFNPFSAGLSSSTTIGWKAKNRFEDLRTIDNSKANRKKVAELQKKYDDLLVLNL